MAIELVKRTASLDQSQKTAAQKSARFCAMISGPSLQSYSGADGQLDELGAFEADHFVADEFCRAKCLSVSEKVRSTAL
jgi:hypothetical protein